MNRLRHRFFVFASCPDLSSIFICLLRFVGPTSRRGWLWVHWLDYTCSRATSHDRFAWIISRHFPLVVYVHWMISIELSLIFFINGVLSWLVFWTWRWRAYHLIFVNLTNQKTRVAIIIVSVGVAYKKFLHTTFVYIHLRVTAHKREKVKL